jgi:hypothetical protein
LSYSEIELDDIPVDAPLNLNADVCEVDEVADVEPIVQFHVEIGAGGELCVIVDQAFNATGLDGPENKNRAGGFNATAINADESAVCS